MNHGGRTELLLYSLLPRVVMSTQSNAVRLVLDNAAAASRARTVQAHLFHANISLVGLYLSMQWKPARHHSLSVCAELCWIAGRRHVHDESGRTWPCSSLGTSAGEKGGRQCNQDGE